MPTFQSKKFRGTAESNRFAAQYRRLMAKHPFLLFGLPFMSVIVAGSFVLTPATAVRYEKHDRRVRQMTRDEELGVGKSGRKVNMKDEYYVGSGPAQSSPGPKPQPDRILPILSISRAPLPASCAGARSTTPFIYC